MRKIIHMPKDKAEWLKIRRRNINSTEISCLFGASPYKTELELWHEIKSGDNFQLEESERMRWGNRLEAAIAEGVAEDKGWKVEPFKEYIEVPDLRIGSSFDYKIISEPEAILEIKNVDGLQFNNVWEVDEDGEIEAPLHIEFQVQWQMLISGLNRAYIAALKGGNEVHIIERDVDQNVCKAMIDAVKRFWKSIDDNKPPTPDFERDAEFISKMYSHAEPNKTMDADERINNLAEKYKELADQEKQIKAQKDAAKAEILTIIDDAEKVKGEMFTISAGVIGEKEISFTRKPYRNFKISWRKNASK